MKYYDYIWDLSEDKIILDEELDINKLGWKHGDLFKVINLNGKAMLVKVDELEKFIRSKKYEQPK